MEDIKLAYQSGNYVGCVKLGLNLLNQPGEYDQERQSIAVLLTLSLMHTRQFDLMLTLLNQLPGDVETTAKTYHDTCMELIKKENGTLILIALETLPKNNITYIFNLYFAGCHFYLNDDWPQAAHHFKKFKDNVHYFFDHIPFTESNHFNVCFRQGTLVADAEEINRRYHKNRDSDAYSRFEIVYDELTVKEKEGTPIIFFSANAPYVELMLTEFCLAVFAVFPNAIIHGNIINPTDDVVNFAKSVFKLHSNRGVLSVIHTDFNITTAYTCGRFFAMKHVLDYHQHEIIAVDMDAMVTNNFKKLSHIPSAFNFSCFDTHRVEPASQFQASIMIFRPHEETKIFLNYLTSFCAEKIHQPARISWMLDQAALFSVIHFFKTDRPDFQFLNLTDHTSGKIDDHVVLTKDFDKKEKLKLITQVAHGDIIEIDWHKENNL